MVKVLQYVNLDTFGRNITRIILKIHFLNIDMINKKKKRLLNYKEPL
jgi:hypothetical protein